MIAGPSASPRSVYAIVGPSASVIAASRTTNLPPGDEAIAPVEDGAAVGPNVPTCVDKCRIGAACQAAVVDGATRPGRLGLLRAAP